MKEIGLSSLDASYSFSTSADVQIRLFIAQIAKNKQDMVTTKEWKWLSVDLFIIHVNRISLKMIAYVVSSTEHIF